MLLSFHFCPLTQKNGKYSAAEKRMETKGPSWRRAKLSLYLIKHRIRYCTNGGAANREPHSTRPGESCQAARNLSMCTRRRHDSLLIHTTIRVARLALPEHQSTGLCGVGALSRKQVDRSSIKRKTLCPRGIPITASS